MGHKRKDLYKANQIKINFMPLAFLKPVFATKLNPFIPNLFLVRHAFQAPFEFPKMLAKCFPLPLIGNDGKSFLNLLFSNGLLNFNYHISNITKINANLRVEVINFSHKMGLNQEVEFQFLWNITPERKINSINHFVR